MEGIDYVVCRECGRKLKRLDNRHIILSHSITSEEYLAKYPGAQMICKNTWDKLSLGTISAWERGCHSAEETRMRKSVSAKLSWRDPARRETQADKISESWERGDHDNQWTEEARAKMSVSISRYMESHPKEMSERALKTARTKRKIGYDKIYTDEVRAKKSRSMIAAWRRGDYDGVFKFPTSIEIAITNALDKYGINHQSQFRPDGYNRIYDELVFPNILIEVQGSYWHSDVKMQERDLEKAKWACDNGYKFIAIWDFHLEEYGAEFLVKNWILPLDPVRNQDILCTQRLF